MKSHAKLLAIFLCCALTGCGRHLSLAVPSTEPVEVVAYVGTDIRRAQLQPSSPEFKRLSEWIANNQKGWSEMYGPNPSGGILVQAGVVHLQFFGPTVFTRTNEGLFEKQVEEKDYAFLKGVVGF